MSSNTDNESLLNCLKILKEELIENSVLNDEVISLLLPINSKILNKEEYEKIFNSTKSNKSEGKIESNNKKRNYEQLNLSNSRSNNINDNSIKENSNNTSTSDLNNQQGVFKAKRQKLSSSIVNPQKKLYSNWSDKKLDEEIIKLNKNVNELEDEVNKDTKKSEKQILRYDELYLKWLKISQDAIHTILEMFPQNQNYESNTIKTLIAHFKIDYELIKFDEENDDFKD